MVKISQSILSVALALSPGDSAIAQRHLPNLQVFTVQVPILVDVQVEHPAVYSGSPALSLPGIGKTVKFQLFSPLASGQEVFEYSVEIEDPDYEFSDIFRVVSVKDWDKRELKPFPGSRSTRYTAMRLDFVVLPPTGHVVTVEVTRVKEVKKRQPIRVKLSVTTVSDPPRRVSRMQGRQKLPWL